LTTLFSPLRFGQIAVSNRIVMAPLTRNRAGAGQIPTTLMSSYYAQRAGAGLIVSEATQVSAAGQGYIGTPGIYTDAQVDGWNRIANAVHARRGRIVMQLWHVGRISHTSLQPGGQRPVSSTARPADTKTFTAAGFEAVSTPRALQAAELPGIVDEFRHAARRAMQAGFDGVEVHGANGYLLEQFLRDSINDRSDEYGGSQPNRVRFPLAVMAAIVSEIGADRVGLRLSPVTPANDAGQDSDAQGLFNYFVERLGPLKLAFMHVVEGATGGARDVAPFDYAALRARFKSDNAQGAWIVNNGYTRAMALEVVEDGAADMVAFGRAYISNPDLAERLRLDAPLAALDGATLYGGGAAGYTDYPAMSPAEVARLEPDGLPARRQA
jgi:N-ethylmaleimide reductase